MAMTGPREREKDRLVLLVLGRDDFLLWRTSIRPLFCQTMTLPHGETANPSGSAIPPIGRVRGVVVFGHTVSDALLTPKRHDPFLTTGVSHASWTPFCPRPVRRSA